VLFSELVEFWVSINTWCQFEYKEKRTRMQRQPASGLSSSMRRFRRPPGASESIIA